MTSIIHSLFNKYLTKDDQMVSAKRSKFFLVPYDDLCFNRKRCGCNAGSTIAILSLATCPLDPVSSSALEFW